MRATVNLRRAAKSGSFGGDNWIAIGFGKTVRNHPAMVTPAVTILRRR